MIILKCPGCGKTREVNELTQKTLHTEPFGICSACENITPSKTKTKKQKIKIPDPPETTLKRICFTVNMIPITLNKLMRMHWAVQKTYKEMWETQILIAANNANIHEPYPFFPYSTVTMTQYRHRLLDKENLYGSTKIVTDQLTLPRGLKKYGAGFIKDDSIKYSVINSEQKQTAKYDPEYMVILIEKNETLNKGNIKKTAPNRIPLKQKV